MAVTTGRTVSRWTAFIVDNSSASMTQIPISGLSVLGVVYEEIDLTAFQDSVKGALPGMPDAPIEITGPFDTTATTGSHTVLSGINGLNTPLGLDVQFGITKAWEAGEPQFGITGSSANGYLCTSYTVDLSTMTYSARFILYPGSAIPAWGTGAES